MRRRMAAEGGFTLLELLIAVAIFSLLAAGLASLLRGGIRIKQRTQEHQARMQIADAVLEEISGNLRNAVGRGPDRFRGTRHEMAFWARQLAWHPDGEQKFQLRRMTYRYDSGARRILRTSTDPKTAVSAPHVLCEDGTGLRFAYRAEAAETDNYAWIDDWSEDERPATVRIELVFRRPSGAEDVWSRVVPIPRVRDAIAE